MAPIKLLSARIVLAALGLALALSAPSRAEESRVVPQSAAQIKLSFAPVVKKAAPAVVNVYAQRVERNRPRNPLFDDPIFRRFFGDRQRSGGATAQSLGSGVIVDPSGLVVTNNHVIANMTDVKVALSDRREFPAEILLRDPRSDLAILRIKAPKDATFPVLEMGDSDTLQVGDIALAIGDPFGVGQTVTQGIISALARTEIGISDYGFFIQTDAAINPGNSGGALVGIDGRLIGINSAIFSQSGGSVGIGFAIPVNMVKDVVATARAGGKEVHRPWLGASLQNLNRDIADSLGLDRPTGALVTDVDPKGPAAEGGLRQGDVITAVDGKEVYDSGSVGYRLGAKPIGGLASLSILRDGKKLVVPLKLMAAPERPPRDQLTIVGSSPFSGATVVNISPATIEEFSIAHAHEGVAVIGVADDTPASVVGVQKGDIVLSLNGEKIHNTRDLQRVAGGNPYVWKLQINRDGQVITSVIGG
ncbi:DegQ family serine endoprotease [Rhodoblastus acidophilus]|uniref:DegQ family serine endoprotease n=1 Tax=Candidatus Rhodoblastus alkanivorans TaxID=2954117 RepID=A0ABS9Z5R0_9HYPH|nr:DegQ family serine endoprotease [Candidatus Rhodoblastus alkanivorans]MCI4680091.1 DegQ family serine endoprotease [Candidatus Rhodoblastus alkanivorans]MCI4682969.1 DegQ family serine endoprotease [Candidatus Rhodoblastus alkanivorans]MDI4640279.1 DegQ family serine endoprotease [Rhodoblastus acidophilus]